jgi:hypothetical protein
MTTSAIYGALKNESSRLEALSLIQLSRTRW